MLRKGFCLIESGSWVLLNILLNKCIFIIFEVKELVLSRLQNNVK